MKHRALLLCLLFSAFICASCGGAYGATQYFWSSGTNTVNGSTLGISVSGAPQSWDALHSQNTGSTDPSGNLRFSNGAGDNWTFLWTRASGDTATYTAVPNFTVSMGYSGPIAIQYGFNNVYDYTQVAWPSGYWVDNSSNWSTLYTSPSGTGTITLNPSNTAITIPSSATQFYIRVWLPNATGSGFADIMSGSVLFQPTTYSPPGSQTILSFGADPTGVNDSTAAIQEAVNQGGLIIIPPGHYLISSTILITRSNTEIQGQTGSELLLSSSDSQDGIRAVIDGSLWTLQNIAVTGVTIVNQVYETGEDLNYTSGINFNGVQSGRVQNCTVTNFQEQGVNLIDCQGVHVTGCTITGARHGIGVNGNEYIGANYGSTDVQIDGNHIMSPWDTGIVIGIHSNDTTASNNIIENSGAHGMDIFNCSNVVVQGNTIKDWSAISGQSVGIFIHPDWGVTVTVPTRNVTVTGNLVNYDIPLPSGFTPIAMQVSGNVDGVNITGNTLLGTYQGVLISEQSYDSYYDSRSDQSLPPAGDPQAPQNVIFNDNIVRGQSGNSISVTTTTSLPITAVISNNTFTPAGTASFTFSVSHPGDIQFSGNTFQSNNASSGMLSGYVTSSNLFLPSPGTNASNNLSAKAAGADRRLLPLGAAGKNLTAKASGAGSRTHKQLQKLRHVTCVASI